MVLAYIALVCSSPRQRSRLFVPAFFVPTICKLYVYALQISICSAKSYARRCDEPVAGKTAFPATGYLMLFAAKFIVPSFYNSGVHQPPELPIRHWLGNW
jgi:hypothetical protein